MRSAKPQIVPEDKLPDLATVEMIDARCRKFAVRLLKVTKKGDAETDFYKECETDLGEAGARFAATIFLLIKTTGGNSFSNNGDVIMPGGKKARDVGGGNIRAGRDVNNSAGGGVNNRNTIRDNTSTTNTVDQSHSVNPKLIKAIESGRAALDKLKIDDAMLEAVKANYEKLATEAQKAEPDKGVLKKLWNGISGFAGMAKPIVGVGKAIAEYCGVKLPGIE